MKWIQVRSVPLIIVQYEGMHQMELRKIFGRKRSSGYEGRRGDERPYMPSPSALQYPGVRPEPKIEPAPKPAPAEMPKEKKEGLPRCPNCGWSIGYMDTKCSNCGLALPR